MRTLDVNPQMQVVGVFLGKREGVDPWTRNRDSSLIRQDRRDLIIGHIIELSR